MIGNIPKNGAAVLPIEVKACGHGIAKKDNTVKICANSPNI